MLNKRRLQPGQRIRVLVVDDSVVIRRLVTHALEEDPLIEVVGAAADGAIALKRIPQLNPDVITLDIEMPEIDGLEMLRRLRAEDRQTRVIMFSTMTERGAAVTLEALSLGADDYVPKASNEGSLDRSLMRLRANLVPKIKQFFEGPGSPEQASAKEPKLVTPPLFKTSRRPSELVAIGVSTGGPNALGEILPTIPARFPAPILIVQHMPPMFTRLLAERLNSRCPLCVEEAKDGDAVTAGRILIAPGDFHMKMTRGKNGVNIVLDQSPPRNSCRPAVDALFSSAAEAYGGAVTAVILTGMGQDGLQGSRILKAAGATVLAQDEATSAVWGMPGAVVEAGIADQVVPLDQIVPEIVRRVQVHRSAQCPV